ncbi:NACHT domain-containing protein [Streptomyces sp. 4N509B]|uniref:NACHT domain-containing protein n=1 Tax=Streptomyces sp. 4N509B TaxID=3457413 RepID=UPI003FD5A345
MAALMVVATVGVWAGTGDVDPAGAVLATVGLLVALWGGYLALVAVRWQDGDTAGLADRLAVEVRKREEEARQRLLGGSDRTINVTFAFVPAPAHNASGARPSGTLEDVADYYRALRPGRLVITGAPGAGKTVLALHLMLLLLADRAAGGPVPVRLSLSSFNPGQQALEEWLVGHLARAYRLRPAAASALVDARLVLPVLDGLDEMDSAESSQRSLRAAAAVETMNAYLEGTIKSQLVVTCRSATYAALELAETWAQDAARVDIAPVTAAAARAFVASRSRTPARWDPVLDAMDADPACALAYGLSTPWRLTMAVVVYDERREDGTWIRDPVELLHPGLRTLGDIRDHLLDLFVPATIRSLASVPGKRHPVPYTVRQVRVWLTVLASYLNSNVVTQRSVAGRLLPSADLAVHELWPLAGLRRARIVHVALFLGTISVVTLPFLMLSGGGEYIVVLVVLGLLISVVATSKSPAYPLVLRFHPPRLRTRGGRFRLRLALGFGLAIGIAVTGVTLGISGEEPANGIWLGAMNGIVGGFVIVFLGGLEKAVPRVEDSAVSDPTLPRQIVLDDLVQAVVFATIFGPLSAFRAEDGLVFGIILGISMIFLAAPVGMRYVAFLLCTRRWWSDQWLPWRLARFLDWCCDAGLMRRTAGIAYQFRHRELQDFLARARPDSRDFGGGPAGS